MPSSIYGVCFDYARDRFESPRYRYLRSPLSTVLVVSGEARCGSGLHIISYHTIEYPVSKRTRPRYSISSLALLLGRRYRGGCSRLIVVLALTVLNTPQTEDSVCSLSECCGASSRCTSLDVFDPALSCTGRIRYGSIVWGWEYLPTTRTTAPRGDCCNYVLKSPPTVNARYWASLSTRDHSSMYS